MGLFSKNNPQPEPLRRKEVMGFVAAAMRESDANPDGAEFVRANEARNEAAHGLTRAEIKAGYEALRRHGY